MPSFLVKIWSFLFSKANKELLIFTFFLVLSACFWLSMTLKENYEKEVRIVVRYVNVPKNAVLTCDETDTLRLRLRDRGTVMATYMYGPALHHIDIDFKRYATSNDMGMVPAGDLQKMVATRLSSSTQILSIKPDRLTFYYNYGERKRVPVAWRGTVTPEDLYFIASTRVKPDSVTIFATREKLDSIHMVYTDALNYSDFRDTLVVSARLQRMKGVKVVPPQVEVSFMTDVLTEGSVSGVAVTGIHVPEGKMLRTFPAKVKVTFVTGVNIYRRLRPSDFSVVADYNELAHSDSTKCRIYLRRMPEGISQAKLNVEHVDYLIEEDNKP